MILSNLQEIYSSFIESDEPKLVCNKAGTHIYRTESAWGRAWSYFHNSDNLPIVFRKTHLAFEKRKKQLKQVTQEYQNYLKSSAHNIFVPWQSYQKQRVAIIKWRRKVWPFLTLSEEKIKQIFGEKVFKVDANLSASAFHLARIIDLENCIQSPVPWHLLILLSQKKLKFKYQHQELIDFIGKIATSGQTLHFFHLALISFENQFEGINFSPEIIEKRLIKLGFPIHLIEDPIHLSWREQLKAGKELVLEDKPYKIKEKIGPDEDKTENAVFTLGNNPDHVLVSGNNLMILKYRQQETKAKTWAIAKAKTIFLDKDGRFAIVEKLTNRFDQQQWTGRKEDEKFLKPIANLLKFMVDQELSTEGFSPKYLMLNKKGELTYTKLSTTIGFSFIELEKFCYEISSENRTVFNYLMTHSKLVKLKNYKNFFSVCLGFALNNHHFERDDCALSNEISDSKTIDHAIAFYDQIKRLYKEILAHLVENYRIDDMNRIKSVVFNCIRDYHKESCHAGTLFPNTKEKILTKIVALEKLIPMSHSAR